MWYHKIQAKDLAKSWEQRALKSKINNTLLEIL